MRHVIEHVEEVLGWMDRGLTAAETAARYENRWGVRFTPEAFQGLYKRVRGRSPVRGTDGVCPLIPWGDLKDERDSYEAGLLRAEWRRRRGIPLTPKVEAGLRRFLDYIEAHDVVLAYDEASEVKWGFLPRRAGIDQDIIREPDNKPHGYRTP